VSNITLTINGKKISAKQGDTILEVAQKAGESIPTMCHHPNLTHHSSCMLCIVKETNTKKIIPSCSHPAEDGMNIKTNSQEINNLRKEALELLLSEHIGNCYAPCTLSCPIKLEIPAILRAISQQNFQLAIKLLYDKLPLPNIISTLCPAPCQKGCRRKKIDSSLQIKKLHQLITNHNLQQTTPYQPISAKTANKSQHIAIIGASIVGLSIAYFLQIKGYQCTILEKSSQVGGKLQLEIANNNLSDKILKQELTTLTNLGIKINCNQIIKLQKIQQKYAVIIMPKSEDNNKENQNIFCYTETDNINTIIKEVSQAKKLAEQIEQKLQNTQIANKPFNSSMGAITNEELQLFLKEAKNNNQQQTITNLQQASQEAQRCLHCDCRKNQNCKLQEYAQKYHARAKQYSPKKRDNFVQIRENNNIIFEPGKCIKCGICVRITEQEQEKLGISFINRGAKLTIATAFKQRLQDGMQKTTDKCITACPTGALAYK